ncbi:MAG: SRPBCC family protein [Actinomycetota bacterium]
MIRGDATAVIEGVTPQEVFDWVLDPRQYSKADTKIVDVIKIADIEGGMIARENGRFMGLIPGSVVMKYQWEEPNRIDVELVHGVPERIHAWFEIEAVPGGTKVRHVEEVEMGHGVLGTLHDLAIGNWWKSSTRKEVNEIKRLMESGERGRGLKSM